MVMYISLSMRKIKNYDYNITQAINSHYDLENEPDVTLD